MIRTTRRNRPAATMLAALCAVTAPAFALPPPPYAVLDISRSQAGLDASSIEEAGFQPTGRDRSATGFGITIGWRFTPHLAVEGAFLDLGEARFDIADQVSPPVSNARIGVQSSGVLLALAGTWPVHDRLSLEGRAGAYIGKTENRAKGSVTGSLAFNNLIGSDSSTSLAVGIGAVASLSDTWALRAGYDHVDKAFGKDARRISFGVRFNWP